MVLMQIFYLYKKVDFLNEILLKIIYCSIPYLTYINSPFVIIYTYFGVSFVTNILELRQY